MMAQWSAHEDEQLRKLVKEYGPKRWSVIASKLKTKGSKQCRRRWKNHLNADLKSGGWTAEEDRILMEGHRMYGNRWTEIAKMVGGRTDNAVKNRYAALCKKDSRGAARGGVARGGRGGRKRQMSDSDGGASDLDVDVDDESDGVEEAKRTSSSSGMSREASPPPRPTRAAANRGGSGGGDGPHSTPPKRGTPPNSTPLTAAATNAMTETAGGGADGPGGSGGGLGSTVLGRRRQPGSGGGNGVNGGGSPPLLPEPEASGGQVTKRRALLMSGGSSSSGVSAGASGRALVPGLTPFQDPLESSIHHDQAQQFQQHPRPSPHAPHIYEQPQSRQQHQQQQQQHYHHQEQFGHGGGKVLRGLGSGAAASRDGPGWSRLAAVESETSPLLQHPSQQQHQAQRQQSPPLGDHLRSGSQDGRLEGGVSASVGSGSGAVGMGVQPKKLPLTINIPNAASAEPPAQPLPTSSGAGYGIEIRVLKDLLTPCEIQYARELNDMQLPLHINVDDDHGSLLISRALAGTAAAAGGGAGGSLLAGGSNSGGGGNCGTVSGGSGLPISSADPLLTTSRHATHSALTALFSPGCATAGTLADFNDVLKWFQTGLTPRGPYGSAGDDGTPRLLSRMGMTPCGSGGGARGVCSSGGRGGCDDDGARMLGTGLTPKCLLDSGNSPESHHDGIGGPGATGLTPPLSDAGSGGSPSKRVRRQIAVAAAVAAASAVQDPPPPQATAAAAHETGCPEGSSVGEGGSGGLGLGLGLLSPASGMELHAGHRQLLTKLIQTAAAEASGSRGSANGSERRLGCPSPSGSVLGHIDSFGAAQPGSLPTNLSSGALGHLGAGPCAVTAGGGGAAGPSGVVGSDGGDTNGPAGQSAAGVGGGVVVMPCFTQQELWMLLEVLNSEDLQALPPPPPPQAAGTQ